MAEKVSAPELRKIFFESLEGEEFNVLSTGNPFLLEIYGERTFVFLKNISPAYYPNYPDISRVQLPFSEHFKTIENSEHPFLILGYCKEYETFTSWNPFEIKGRLNLKANVSLFTRASFQEKIRLNIFKERFISNGDKIILFDRRTMPMFFKNYHTLFAIRIEKRNFKYIKTKAEIETGEALVKYGEIDKIDDQAIIRDLIPFQKNSDIIGAVLMCCEKYANQYPDMGLNQWRKLVSNYFLQKDIYLFK